MNVDSLERIVPEQLQAGEVTGRETLGLHMDRYRFAAKHVRPPRVLDIACGAGYGTEILTTMAAAPVTAVGVDISENAVDYAKKKYGSERARFVVSDAMTFEDAEGFDTVVSLETIEHLPAPGPFIGRLVSLLRPGGILIGSVPSTPSVDANPYHLHDFTERSFRKYFLDLGLLEIDCLRQIQRFNPLPLLGGREARSESIRKNLLGYYSKNPSGLVKRVYSTLRYGFSNRYLTVVWRAPQS